MKSAEVLRFLRTQRRPKSNECILQPIVSVTEIIKTFVVFTEQSESLDDFRCALFESLLKKRRRELRGWLRLPLRTIERLGIQTK